MGRGPVHDDAELDSLLRSFPIPRDGDDDPTLGGFLLRDESRNLRRGHGTLVAVLHQRHEYPEWIRVDMDCRAAWRALRVEDKEQLLQIERDSRDDNSALGVLIPQDLAGRIESSRGRDGSKMTILAIGAIPDEEGPMGPRLAPEQLAFLWVINEYVAHHGGSPVDEPVG